MCTYVVTLASMDLQNVNKLSSLSLVTSLYVNAKLYMHLQILIQTQQLFKYIVSVQYTRYLNNSELILKGYWGHECKPTLVRVHPTERVGLPYAWKTFFSCCKSV